MKATSSALKCNSCGARIWPPEVARFHECPAKPEPEPEAGAESDGDWVKGMIELVVEGVREKLKAFDGDEKQNGDSDE